MVLGLFLVERRVRLGYGRYRNRHRLWRHRWRSIGVECGRFRSIVITHRLCRQVVTGRVLSGTWRRTHGYSAYSSQPPSNRHFSTPNNTKSSQLVPIAKLPIGRSTMVQSSAQSKDLRRSWILSTWRPRVNTLCWVGRMVGWRYITMMRGFAIMRVRGTLIASTRWRSRLISELSSPLVHRVLSFSGGCQMMFMVIRYSLSCRHWRNRNRCHHKVLRVAILFSRVWRVRLRVVLKGRSDSEGELNDYVSTYGGYNFFILVLFISQWLGINLYHHFYKFYLISNLNIYISINQYILNIKKWATSASPCNSPRVRSPAQASRLIIRW